jgi:polysaccharide export outer membrane protein
MLRWGGASCKALRIVVLAFGAFFAHEVHAQNQGGIEGLLEGLQTLQERGDLGGAFRTSPESLLDDSRLNGRGRAIGPGNTNVRVNDTNLSLTEEAFLSQFCEGNILERDRKFVGAIRVFSPVEMDYCQRAKTLVLQVGYQLFDGVYDPEFLVNGAVQGDFILGVGDELIVTIQGGEAQSTAVTVDREGNVILESLRPVPAAGRPFADVVASLRQAVSSAFLESEVYVSLGSLRQIRVSVVGEVPNPGSKVLTPLSSVLDAIGLAGGIKKVGSLRKVQISGARRPNRTLDLYDILFRGGTDVPLGLQEGDLIVVSPIGQTVSVIGGVTKPGIYELTEAELAMPAKALLDLAGGTIRPRGNRYTRQLIGPLGRELIEEYQNADFAISSGDLILIDPIEDRLYGAVSLVGHVSSPGRRGLGNSPTIASLVGDGTHLLGDTYIPMAVLRTTDFTTKARRRFPINLQNILSGREDFELRDGDELVVFSTDDVRYLSSVSVQQVIGVEDEGNLTRERDGRDRGNSAQNTRTPEAAESLTSIASRFASVRTELEARMEPSGGNGSDDRFRVQPECSVLDALRLVVARAKPGQFANALVSGKVADNGFPSRVANDCPEVFRDDPELLTLLLEHGVLLTGEVRRPGVYPVVDQISLATVSSFAGGLTRDADLSKIEVTAFPIQAEGGERGVTRAMANLSVAGLSETMIGPGDVVRFSTAESLRGGGPVILGGEFVRPGAYTIRRGERLSELVLRAGGLTPQAYPFGAVFTRSSVKRAEQIALRRLSRDLNAALALAAATKDLDGGAITALAQLASDVGSAGAVGRVVIEADPTVLQVRPELDAVLQPGDKIFMPKRPSSVLVTGDVLNPGALQFISGKSVDSYLRQAGGFQRSADKSRVFVVLPNGAAQPVSVSPFIFTSIQIPPGATIVVPKDATPLNILSVSKDIASIVSQLAVTAASLAVINN